MRGKIYAMKDVEHTIEASRESVGRWALNSEPGTGWTMGLPKNVWVQTEARRVGRISRMDLRMGGSLEPCHGK